MKSKYSISIPLLAVLALIALPACDSIFDPDPGPETWHAVHVDERVTDAYTGFGFELFRRLRAGTPEENVFASPTSAAFALAMTYNGAVGVTAEEMAAVLGVGEIPRDELNAANRTWLEALADTQDPRVELAVANSIWSRLGFPVLEDFLARVETYYLARAAELDFNDPAARDAINAWAADNTNGRIESILDEPIGGDVVMYLINALYFQADWRYRFDPAETRDRPFHRPDGTAAQVPMMSLTAALDRRHDDLAEMVRLPYGNGRFSMVLALPRAEVGLAGLAEALEPGTWRAWMAEMEEAPELGVRLPRFEVEWESSLVGALIAMGMEVPFEASTRGGADFSDLSPLGDELFISEVLQKTFLSVDEEGTEAAAVTAVEISRTVSAGPPVIVFDRPFFLAIYDHATETVLFLGQITDPSA